MAIGITRLMSAIGDDRIQFQMLDNAMTSIRSAKQHTTISFQTQALNATDAALGDGKVGFIVWVDRDVLNTEMATLRAQDNGEATSNGR
ncbi:hypothetical protein C9415_21950 [Kluyvera sp. Nf5]|nr:hypothetical protein C9415_21950 [Kluyvera sp. Nf5]TCW43529.1 hypothetical protein EDC53_116110 [Phytobacter diazotrophicus]